VSDISRDIEWVPKSALDRMQSDLILQGEVTRAALAEKIIADASPLAAYSVVDLAANSEDEAVRLKAAAYILDRANGKAKTTTTLNLTQDNPVLKIMEGVVVERGNPEPGTPHSPDSLNPTSSASNPSQPDDFRSPYPPSGPTVIDQAPFAPPIPEAEDTGEENP